MSNLLDALYSKAWAIQEGKLRDIETMLLRHAQGASLPEERINEITEGKDGAAFEGLSGFDRAPSGAYVRKDGVAYVPLHGTIVNRAGMMDRMSGATSPQSVQEKLRSAAADEDVDRIVLNIDSPGGTVAGTMQTANTVAEVAGEKEVVAVGENTIASAAYWIGTHATKLVVGEGAQVGSIGVIAVHRDYTERLEEEGIESTIVRIQGDKALGHPEEPLSDEAREQWEERLSGYYDLFVEAVAGSMNVSETTLRQDIGSRSYMGREAVGLGLADEVGSLAMALQQSVFSNPNDNEPTMSIDEQSRIEELEAKLEAQRERAEQAEEEAEEALSLAEEQAEQVAQQQSAALQSEAEALVDDEIIGKGKAKPSQRESLLSDCQDDSGAFAAGRIQVVRNVYRGVSEGAAVPVDGTGLSDETERSGEEAREAEEEYDLRSDLESNLPPKYRGEIG